jgi:hypothetical protein
MRKWFLVLFIVGLLSAGFDRIFQSQLQSPTSAPSHLLPPSRVDMTELVDPRFNPSPQAPLTDALAAELRNLDTLPPSRENRGPIPTLHEWQEKVLAATDYAAFVREARPVAESGNGDAQCAMYAALSFCRDGLRKRPRAELAQLPQGLLDDMHARCDTLAREQPDLAGEARRWLDRAVAAKFPRAIALDALDDLYSMSPKLKRDERRTQLTAVRSRLMGALRTNDPAITFMTGTSLHRLFPDDERVRRGAWIWMLAACEQGLRCSPEAEWLKDMCLVRNDCRDGESGEDYIRRVSGDFPRLLSRARNLARALRYGVLEEETFVMASLGVTAK